MSCSFYNFNYRGTNIPVKKQYKCDNCPHNKNNFCEYFGKELTLDTIYEGIEKIFKKEYEEGMKKIFRKYIEFHLISNGRVIDRGNFDTMDSAVKSLYDYRLNLKPGIYTVLNTKTRETQTFDFTNMFDLEISIESPEFDKIDFDIDFEGLLNPEIGKQKTCHHCISNKRGSCLKYMKNLIEAKSLCYKESE